jgi:hypothetical protein
MSYADYTQLGALAPHWSFERPLWHKRMTADRKGRMTCYGPEETLVPPSYSRDARFAFGTWKIEL